jgi:hypothetical protein
MTVMARGEALPHVSLAPFPLDTPPCGKPCGIGAGIVERRLLGP